jgi:hypothetical protein
MSEAILFHVPRYSAHPAGPDTMLLVTAGRPEVLEVEASVTRLLGLCEGARTIANHVEAVMRVTRWPERAVRASIEALVLAGLLKPVPEPAEKAQPPADAIAAICIQTADRPDRLARCLSEGIAHTLTHGRRPRFFVVDGSQDRDNQARTRSVVEGAQPGAAVIYVGPSEARAIASRLASLPVDPRLLRLALCTGTVGANRNLSLLLTAGQPILMVDDDTRWSTWRPAVHDDRIRLAGHRNVVRWRFFADRAAAYDAALKVPIDLLRAHETLLGRDLWGLAGAGANMGSACGHLLAELTAETPPVVRVTVTGVAGDARWYCPDRLLFFDESARAALGHSSELRDGALSRPAVHRITESSVITHDFRYVSGLLGLANTTPLPPFLPVGLNEDGVFAAMLSATTSKAVWGHLPCGVFCESFEPWRSGPRQPAAPTQVLVAQIVAAILSPAITPYCSRSSAYRFRRVGLQFSELATLSFDDFRELTTRILTDDRSRKLRQLDSSPNEMPEGWRAAAGRFRSDLLADVQAPDFCCPTEFKNGATAEASIRQFQCFLGDLGELIALWPGLWERSAGVGPESLLGN